MYYRAALGRVELRCKREVTISKLQLRLMLPLAYNDTATPLQAIYRCDDDDVSLVSSLEPYR
jgi:hypothetical protein